MKQPFVNAFAYIDKFIHSLLPHAKLQRGDAERLAVTDNGARAILRFGCSQLEDLEGALEGDQPVSYSNGLKTDVQFQIYVALGSEGMLPDVRISSAMLEEQRDWRTNIRLDTHFPPQLAEQLNGALKTLVMFLKAQLTGDVEVPELQHDIEVINILTNWYSEKGNLNSGGVTSESLSYLKAAAVCVVIELERKRDGAISGRVQKAYTDKIYEIVQAFRAEPYRWIKLPPVVYE